MVITSPPGVKLTRVEVYSQAGRKAKADGGRRRALEGSPYGNRSSHSPCAPGRFRKAMQEPKNHGQ